MSRSTAGTDAPPTSDGARPRIAKPLEPEDAVFGRDLWRLIPFVRPYKGRVWFGVLTNAMARVFDLVPLFLIGMIVDDIINALDSGTTLVALDFTTYGLWIFGTFLGLAVFQTASDYAWDTLAQKVRHDIRVAIYDHVQGLDVAFFEDRQTGDIMSVLSNDVDNLENFLADATTSIIRMVITFVGTFAFMLYMNWYLAALLFAPLPFAIFTVRYFATRVQPQYRKSREAVGSINSIVENNLQGIGVIQAYTAEASQAQRIYEQSGHYRDAAIGAARVRARFVPMLYVIAGFAFAALIGVGGWLTFSGRGPTVGEYSAFILFAMRLIMPLFILGMLLNQIQRSEASAKRIIDLLQTQPKIRDAPDAGPVHDAPRKVVFDDIRFAYGDRAPVLNGVSFTMARGQVIGIVGHTGAGKSTLIKLLLRYYDPVGGHVTIDGRPLDKLKLASYRKHIGYVSQEPYIFAGTVADNIRLGSPEATLERVAEAARIAGADEFIDELPEGYDTVVGERGMKLSGGQRQRLNLARAVLRDPPILVLDEATSAVDTRTERIIQDNLHKFREGRMTMAVAHRLSTIRHSDEILVMVDGCVVERGDHEHLIAEEGVYADLWNVQSGQQDAHLEPVRAMVADDHGLPGGAGAAGV